jgi:hypothetical protein
MHAAVTTHFILLDYIVLIISFNVTCYEFDHRAVLSICPSIHHSKYSPQYPIVKLFSVCSSFFLFMFHFKINRFCNSGISCATLYTHVIMPFEVETSSFILTHRNSLLKIPCIYMYVALKLGASFKAAAQAVWRGRDTIWFHDLPLKNKARYQRRNFLSIFSSLVFKGLK